MVSGICPVSPTKPNYITRVSAEEAQILLAEYQVMQSDVPIQQGMITQAVKELTQLLDDYGQGRAIYQARFPQNETIEKQNTSEQENPLARTEGLESLTYPEKLHIPGAFKQADRIGLSQANYEDLKKDQPMGSIEPRSPDKFFPSQELLTPLPDGYTQNLGLADYYPSNPCHEFTAPQQKNQQIKISCPKQGFYLPMPNNSEPASLDDNQAKLAKPTGTDPLIWRINTKQDTLNYSIQERSSDDVATLDLKANPDLIPTQEEQEYWQQALPLPEILKQKIQESPKDLLRLLVSYLGIKNKETGLTNFTYSANAMINEFIKEHKADLPLIVSELKTGHCDTLSWYLAALLRAQGKPAWVSRGLVTTDNGKAFQGAYGHSVVMTVDAKNQIIQIDPTQYTEHNPAYLPEEFAVDAFYKMQAKFSKAKTNKTKAKYLQEFNQALEKTRKEIAANPTRKKRTQASMSAMMGYFSMLSELSDSSEIQATRALSKQIVNFRAEEDSHRKITARMVVDLLPKDPDRDSYLPRYSVNFREVDTPGPFKDLDTKTARENLIEAHRLAKKAKLPLYKLTIFIKNLLESMNLIIDKDRSSLEDQDLKTLVMNYYSTGTFEYSDVSNILENFELKKFPTQFNMREIQKYHEKMPMIKATSSELLDHHYSQDFQGRLVAEQLIKNIEVNAQVFRSLIDGVEFSSRDQPKCSIDQYFQDLLYFHASFQKACVDSRFRAAFLTKINKDQLWFRRVAEIFFCDRKAQKTPERKDHGVYKKYQRDFFYPYQLEPDDQSRLSKLFKTSLRRFDTQFSTGQVTEDKDLRLYSYGDSVRDVNWKATARSEKIYVNKQPRIEAGASTPLHVLVSVNDTVMSRLQLLELVRILQQDIKKTNREVFLAFQGNDNFYVALNKSIKPETIVQSLMPRNIGGELDAKNQACHLDPKGKPISNLLCVTDDYNRISALNYLYSGVPRTNLQCLYLKESRYDVYPQINKAWVNEVA